MDRQPNPKPSAPNDAREQQRLATEKPRHAMHALREIAHISETTTSFLHKLHLGLVATLELLEKLIPPIRLALVGISSILEALNAVYFSKKSKAHRSAQILIAIVSTLTVIISLAVPHAALAMLITYAAVECFREITHFIEAFKDFWRLRKVKHAINQQKLAHIQDFLIEKAVDIGFGIMAVVGATFTLFSTAALFATPLPVIGLSLLITSGIGALVFRVAFTLIGKINHWRQTRKQPGPTPIPSTENATSRADTPNTAPVTTPAHTSTTDVYHMMDLLKHEANQQQQLAAAGWQKQPLMSQTERDTRLAFWREHRLTPTTWPSPLSHAAHNTTPSPPTGGRLTQ